MPCGHVIGPPAVERVPDGERMCAHCIGRSQIDGGHGEQKLALKVSEETVHVLLLNDYTVLRAVQNGEGRAVTKSVEAKQERSETTMTSWTATCRIVGSFGTATAW